MRLPPFFRSVRNYTMIVAAVLLNLKLFGLSLRSVCAPGFNCHGCAWATCACPIGTASFGLGLRTLPAFAIGSMLAVGVVLGRLVCGYACPFGLLQDGLYRIPARKIDLPKFLRWGKYLALALLVVGLPLRSGFTLANAPLKVGTPTVNAGGGGMITVDVELTNLGDKPLEGVTLEGIFLDQENDEEIERIEQVFPGLTIPPGETVKAPTFEVANLLDQGEFLLTSPQSAIEQEYGYYYCKYCPNGTLTAMVPALLSGSSPEDKATVYIIGGERLLRIGILVAFLVLMALVSRPFCRIFCPLGAVYGLFNRAALLRIVVDKDKCVRCGRCDQFCPVGLDVEKEAGGPECIYCGECIRVCHKDAIRRTWRLCD